MYMGGRSTEGERGREKKRDWREGERKSGRGRGIYMENDREGIGREGERRGEGERGERNGKRGIERDRRERGR